MPINEIINRRSIRTYLSKPVSDEDITEVIKAAQFAPSSRNNKSVEFVVVKDQQIKDQLFQIVGQDFIREAPVIIIPVTNPAQTNQPVQDLSIASGFMMLQATALGLGSVWKNLAPEWQESVKQILNIPDHLMVINILPLGYAAEQPAAHTDADFSVTKIHPEKW